MLAKSRQSILPVTLQLNQPTDSSAHFPHFPQTLIELMSFDPSLWAILPSQRFGIHIHRVDQKPWRIRCSERLAQCAS